MTDKVDKIEVIRASDLKPGDIVIIHVDKAIVPMKDVSGWADIFFKGTGVKVAVCPKGACGFDVISKSEAEEKKIVWKEFL